MVNRVDNERIRDMYLGNSYSVQEITKTLGISQRDLYKALDETGVTKEQRRGSKENKRKLADNIARDSRGKFVKREISNKAISNKDIIASIRNVGNKTRVSYNADLPERYANPDAIMTTALKLVGGYNIAAPLSSVVESKQIKPLSIASYSISRVRKVAVAAAVGLASLAGIYGAVKYFSRDEAKSSVALSSLESKVE